MAGQQTALKKVLGIWALFAVAAGVLVMQGTLVSVLQGVGNGGVGFLYALLLAFILSLTYVYSFAELSLLLPRAGSISAYTEVALGHFLAIIAPVAGYLAPAIFGISAELLLVERILQEMYPGTFSFGGVGLTILALIAVLNLLGIDIFARVQTVLTFTMVVALAAVGIVGVSGLGAPSLQNVSLLSGWTWPDTNVFSLTALAIWAFLGLEFICPLVEECKQPQRDIPRAMLITAVVLLVIYVLLVLAAMAYVPAAQLADPNRLPHKDLVLAIFGQHGMLILLVVAFTATCSTVNTVIAAVPRMLYGMSHSGQLPAAFKKVHPRFQTPWVGIIFVALLIAVPTIAMRAHPDVIQLLLISAAASWLIAYILAHIDVMVLRHRYPDVARPFKTPFYPIPQIIGIVGMVYVFINNSPSPELTKSIYLNTGVVLLVAAAYAAIWVKWVMKRRLFEPESLEQALRE